MAPTCTAAEIASTLPIDTWATADETCKHHDRISRPRVGAAEAELRDGRDGVRAAILRDITQQKWHSMWSATVAQAQAMLTRK
jgi:hypothetical protein